MHPCAEGALVSCVSAHDPHLVRLADAKATAAGLARRPAANGNGNGNGNGRGAGGLTAASRAASLSPPAPVPMVRAMPSTAAGRDAAGAFPAGTYSARPRLRHDLETFV